METAKAATVRVVVLRPAELKAVRAVMMQSQKLIAPPLLASVVFDSQQLNRIIDLDWRRGRAPDGSS